MPAHTSHFRCNILQMAREYYRYQWGLTLGTNNNNNKKNKKTLIVTRYEKTDHIAKKTKSRKAGRSKISKFFQFFSF